MQAAVTHYKKVHGEDGSTLIAKALTSLGRCKELTNQLKAAGDHFSEAVKIFEKRAGKGPLLAGALGHQGKNQLKQQKFDSATASLFSAVELEVSEDALKPQPRSASRPTLTGVRMGCGWLRVGVLAAW